MKFAFGVITDAQYCDAAEAGTRFYRASPQKLAACVDVLNAIDLAFVIDLGDVIDRDFASFDVMSPIYDRLKAPCYHVLGNHEFAVADDAKRDVPGKLGMAGRYYEFRTRGWRFLVLDGNDLSLVARDRSDPEYAQAQQMYETLKKSQCSPGTDLERGDRGKAARLVAHTVERCGGSRRAGAGLLSLSCIPRRCAQSWNDTEVIRVLEDHPCVAAWMNGHNHSGDCGQRKGIHYVTFPGMVETAVTTALAVVTVRPDRLEIAGFGRTPSRVLQHQQGTSTLHVK